MEKFLWLYNKYVISTLRFFNKNIIKRTIEPVKYAGKKILSIEEGNQYIFDKLNCGEPLMICRYGAFELKAMVEAAFIECSLQKNFGKNTLRYMCNNAGFFPYEEEKLLSFSRLMMICSKKADLIGVWFNSMEDSIIKKYGGQASLTYLRALEPWYSEKPWTRVLEGKKVLVIHPFEDTIKEQYLKRDKLFENSDMLPKFTLFTLKSVQTAAGQNDNRFKTWFDALEYMYQEAIKMDFDVAILGCGAYGLPLAAKLKDAGKQAIHLGGATQLLFGIKGKRWDDHPVISKLYNEHWVRPMKSEKPENSKTIENGCYW